MAGTLSDQATLATNEVFINTCRAALCVFRSKELLKRPGSDPKVRSARATMVSAVADAQDVAWLLATGDMEISARAPELPSDEIVQAAVNRFVEKLE